jgi:ribosome production factor 2
MKKREPQVHEGAKNLLCVRGSSTSEIVSSVLKDLYALKKPASKHLQRKNLIRPFEDASSIEFLGDKNQCSLFAFGSHSKKRPHNLVLGRLFDYKLLDMMEWGIVGYTPIEELAAGGVATLGAKPCMIFQGDVFEHDLDMRRAKNMLLDFFRGEEIEKLALTGLQNVIVVTGHGKQLHIRVYMVRMMKSGTKVPKVGLKPCGPNLDLKLRRTHYPSPELDKASKRQPRELRAKKVKNVEYSALGDKMGRVHMRRQDYDDLTTRKVKALKSGRDKHLGIAESDEEVGSIGSDSDVEGGPAEDTRPRPSKKRKPGRR